MSAGHRGQGSMDPPQLSPSIEGSGPSNANHEGFRATGENRGADHITELKKTLEDLDSRIQPGHPHPHKPPNPRRDPRCSFSTAQSSTQTESSGTSRQSQTTAPTEVTSESQARHGASTGHLKCPYFGKSGLETLTSCQITNFKYPSGLKLHFWRFHVHKDDQDAIHKQHMGDKADLLQLYQAAGTTDFLNDHPLYRLRNEQWKRIVEILSGLNKKRSRSSDIRPDERSKCNSDIEEFLFPGHDIEPDSRSEDTGGPISAGEEVTATSVSSETGETNLQSSGHVGFDCVRQRSTSENVLGGNGVLLYAIGAAFEDFDDVQLGDIDRLFAEMKELNGKST
ncbi:hypothetical protein CaCOL14_009394 [Colletotrichum acutatum]